MARATRIVIVGGGYVGMYTALRLQKKLRRGEAEVTVIDPQPHMTYQPFLPEASAGSIEPRHVVVPLRRVLRKCHVYTGRVTAISHAEREVTVELADGHVTTLGFDVLVVAPGSVARTLPIPGLAECGIAFKTIGEAIYLRNHVLSRLDAADTTIDPTLRRRLLTFMVVGGGYAGVEALAELADMARYASRYYPTIDREDIRWILVEASGRIMPEVEPEDGALHRRAAAGRRHRGQPRHPREVDGRRPRRARRRAGVRRRHDHLDGRGQAQPDAGPDRPAPRQPRPGRVRRRPAGPRHAGGVLRRRLRVGARPVQGRPRGPDQPVGAARRAAGEGAGRQRRRPPARRPLTEYKHSYAGSVASLGLYKGVAEIYGIKLRGIVAWFMHRTYHVSRMPTWNRRIRIVFDWTGALFLGREVVSLGQINDPKAEFERVAAPERKVSAAPPESAGS